MLEKNQINRYKDFYSNYRKLRWFFRFDVRYRCRRIHEVLREMGIKTEGKRVLDFGFGAGDLLRSFPESCSITGVDVSESAVASAQKDERFKNFSNKNFIVVPENDPNALPEGPFDIIITSHALEHVYQEKEVLETMKKRLVPGGILAVYVPIEEPDYIMFHIRNYSLQSITLNIANAAFQVERTEGSMYINGHIWKIITIPSHRAWPVIGTAVNVLRLATLSLIPYHGVKLLDSLLYRLGFGARQALVIAKKPVAK